MSPSSIPELAPPKTPPERILEGVRVLVLTSGHEATDSRIYAKEAEGVRALGADVTVVGKLERGNPGAVRVLVIPPAKSRLERFLRQPWRCLWRARHETPDIVHFHDAEMLAVLPVARLMWPRSKFVYDVHEDFANLMLVREWLPGWAKPAIRALTDVTEKSLARLAHGIVGVTPPLARKFSQRQSAVVYNFVASDFFRRAAKAAKDPRDREYDVLHLGTLSSRRALFLAEIFQEIHRARPETRSMILGATPDIVELLTGRVPAGCDILGKRPYGEMAGFLGNARVGLDVHPWLGPHLEVALPVKVCEYMGAGCAVVSSRMPVLDALLKESGVRPDDFASIGGGEPADYARATVAFLEKIERGDNPGERLAEIAREHMSFEGEARELAGLYLSLLGRPCAA